jgi:hypothetical protein
VEYHICNATEDQALALKMLAIGLVAGLGTVAFAPVSLAQSPVQHAVESAELGGEFRAEYEHLDNGLGKTSTKDPDSTDHIKVVEANLTVAGKLAAKAEYFFKFGLLNPNTHGTTALEEGWTKYNFTEVLGISIGKQLVHQGGWDQTTENFSTLMMGKLYAAAEDGKSMQHLPLGDIAGYSPAIALHIAVAGEVVIQVVNDVVDTASTMRWNEREKPTWVLSWHGKFGPISPLIHFGSYDNDKSLFVDVGVQAKMANFWGFIDYINISNSNKYTDPNDTTKSKGIKDITAGYNIRLAYSVPDIVTPELYYSAFNRKEGTDTDIPGRAEEKEFNSTDDTKGIYVYDDNAQTLGLSVNVTATGKTWQPYLAFEMSTGKFEDDESTDVETRKESAIRVGVNSNF